MDVTSHERTVRHDQGEHTNAHRGPHKIKAKTHYLRTPHPNDSSCLDPPAPANLKTIGEVPPQKRLAAASLFCCTILGEADPRHHANGPALTCNLQPVTCNLVPGPAQAAVDVTKTAASKPSVPGESNVVKFVNITQPA